MTVLAHQLVTASSAAPEKWMLFLHGILGSGANWRTFAKQIVAERPAWGAALVDLRLHGDSQAFPPPHTVAAAAADLEAPAATLPGPVRGVFGHSFGGKVALAFAGALQGRQREHLEQAFVVDSTPGARPDSRGSESTREIIELLFHLPAEFPDRAAFTAWIEQRGVSRPTAMWLAMNVRPVPNTTRFTFRLDMASIRAMVDDYMRLDLWSVVESPPGAMRVHLIKGGASTVVDDGDVARARRAQEATGGRTTIDVVAGAGHWVHVDAPDALRALVLGYL